MPSLHKIALLGGSGFIGSRLTSDLLYQGHDVTIADIAPSPSYPDLRINADVREYESLLAACSECDTIINLAAAHRDNVRPISLYYDTNVTGARMTCAVAEKLGINRIVFTSSVAVYGHQHGEPDETASHMPINPYGETKSQAENVFREWFDEEILFSILSNYPTEAVVNASCDISFDALGKNGREGHRSCRR